MNQLPETGFLSLSQIIGQEAVTENQAEENRKRGKGPKRSRPASSAIVPVKKSCWWAGVKSGRFPKPVKIGNGRGTFWKVESIRALIASA
ncbi:MAG: transcriptional regulator [Betaproteobacteria bacterium]|nr:transcriptional regulator [Betaproteobacteria bacterium]